MKESISLEGKGFRFIETVLHPVYRRLDAADIVEQGMCVLPANEADLPILRQIAETAFSHERFHVDPRIPVGTGDRRYGRWVETTLTHGQHRLLKVVESGEIVALFIIEDCPGGGVHWHLTAVAPWLQGTGRGRRAWLTMMRWHQACGRREITTTISVRNIPVLNLYSNLNFRFRPPEMTFHWMRD